MVVTVTSKFAGGDSRKHRARRMLGAACLLCCHAVLLAWSALLHSPTIDEVRWLPAGLHHWQTGTFTKAIVNPPLVRLIAAVPVLCTLAHEGALAQAGPNATDLVRAYGLRAFWLFTIGRWACIPISLMGGYICYRWARQLYGTPSAFLALTLWCFSPNILAHGQIISNDCAAASFGVAASYTFWCWLRRPTWRTIVVAGFILGLAELAKMSLLILFVAFPAAWLIWRLTDDNRDQQARWLRSTAQLCCIFLLAIDVVNFGYLCEGTGQRLRDFGFFSRLLGGPGADDPQGGNRFAGSVIGQIPVPLPVNYVRGLDRQKRDLEQGNAVQFSYLRGQWSRQGWWYFYLYAFAIKVPLGTWCLLLLSASARMLPSAGSLSRWRDEILLVLPPTILVVIASLQRGFTDHFRYLLPVLPCAFIWISRVAGIAIQRKRTLGVAVLAALAWSVTSSLSVYPHSLSYFNELAGGPRGGHYHLLSSNIDYGQDLLFLKKWVDQHPEARPIQLAIWNLDTVEPAVAGIEYTVAPSAPPPGATLTPNMSTKYGPQPGWFAINVNVLHGDDWPGRETQRDFGYYGYFLNFKPVATAGYSIYVYHITPADAERYWSELKDVPRSAASSD
jgi:hypothetical protein